MMLSGACTIEFTKPTGVLKIDGTNSADTATVEVLGKQVVATLDCNGQVVTTPKPLKASKVQKIEFTGLGDDDKFTNKTNIASYADGGSGGDTLIGGSGNDTLNGGIGADELHGYEGNDVLNGGTNNDSITGGDGNDTITGSYGNDLLFGDVFCFLGPCPTATGDDEIHGGPGNDTLSGGGGNDKLSGDTGADEMYGDAGNDFLDAGDEPEGDTVQGGSGNDTFVAYIVQWGFFGFASTDHIQDFENGSDDLEWKMVEPDF